MSGFLPRGQLILLGSILWVGTHYLSDLGMKDKFKTRTQADAMGSENR